MLGTLSGFDWDEGNRAKCRKHGVSPAEIEALFVRPGRMFSDAGHSATEERFRIIGRTDNGRYVFLVFTVREKDGRKFVRPISARYMHRKEIEHYEEGTSNL